MKQFIIAVVVLMFSAPAFAILPPAWIADGYREMSSSNTTLVTYMPWRSPRHLSEDTCLAYVDAVNEMPLYLNVKGKDIQTKVHAKCVLTEFAD